LVETIQPGAEGKAAMPHIVETTPRLSTTLDFGALFSVIHQWIADNGGRAALNDFKSRVHSTDRHLAAVMPER
jgi:5-carboxymethyl-2-hydroxymuconate isomerase